ncbi:hypothetical protein ACFPM0_07360 [Pseudonocardia sulfidoxydans]|uniref:hypothetical protein n=1 Tax=Pseudonocardia sulfidoxydans TaxID=54011 RepID=UPI003619C89A
MSSLIVRPGSSAVPRVTRDPFPARAGRQGGAASQHETPGPGATRRSSRGPGTAVRLRAALAHGDPLRRRHPRLPT